MSTCSVLHSGLSPDTLAESQTLGEIFMISYHLVPPGNDKSDARAFAWNFKQARIDDIRREANAMQRFVWSPNLYVDGHRCEDSWRFANWLVLDFDSGEMTLDGAMNIFSDVQHVIGTTMNHQIAKDGAPPRDRFRVALRTQDIKDLGLLRHNLALLVKRYDADNKCKDGARFFYPCREIVSINDGGYLWDIDMNAPEPFPVGAAIKARVTNRTIPTALLALLSEGVFAPGTKNDTCFRIGCALGPLGFHLDEICALIYSSPTYKDAKISAALRGEIVKAVSNGIKRGYRDLAQLPVP